MAEGDQDKSELPTSYKLTQARKKGAVAKGTDLGFLTASGVALGFLWWSGPQLAGEMSWQLRMALLSASTLAEGGQPLWVLARNLAWPLAGSLGLLLAALFLIVGTFEIVQTGFVITTHPLKPDFSRLNPAQGLKRLFSIRLLIETFKSTLKFVMYSAATWVILQQVMSDQLTLIVDGPTLVRVTAHAVLRLIAAFVGIALFFTLIDQIISRRQFATKMRMSRREVRREHREREGDPRLKQKRRQLHGEFVKASQSLANLKGADVLIVNPQHVAIALQYNRRRMIAPKVVSSGKDALALKLKGLALLYGVPVVEDRVLARRLFRQTRLNETIPDELFASVAQVYNRVRRDQRQTGNDV